MSAKRACQGAADKAAASSYLAVAMLSALVGRGALRRDDAAFILETLDQAMAGSPERAKIAAEVRAAFDRVDALRQKNLGEAVKAAGGTGS